MTTHRKLVTCVLLIFALTGATTASAAGTSRLISQMEEEVRAFEGLSPGETENMVGVLRRARAQFERPGADKLAHAAEHLRFFLQKSVPSETDLFYEERFSLFLEEFEWALGNYARLPALTDEERDQLDGLLTSAASAAETFVNQSYEDTPAEVRARIVDEMRQIVTAQFDGKLGNYFYGHYVYPARAADLQHDMFEVLVAAPFLQDNADKHARFLAETDGMTSRNRGLMLNTFVSREAGHISHSLGPALREAFDQRKADRAWKPRPRGLLKRQNELEERVIEEATRRAQNLPRREVTQQEEQRFRQEFLEQVGLGEDDVFEALEGDTKHDSASDGAPESGESASSSLGRSGPSPQSGANTAPDARNGGSAVPFVIAIALVGGLGVAAALLIRKRARNSSQRAGREAKQ